MNNDRFTDFDDEVKQLVLDFERTVMHGDSQFFDVDELEMIIDYYLEVGDKEPLITAIVYAEQLYPDSPEIKIRRAHWYIANQKYEQALTILLSLEEQSPNDTDVAYSLGVLYGELKQHEKAIDYFLQAATDGWQVGRIYSNIAEEYYHLKDFSEAIRYYKLALTSDSYDAETLYNYLDTCEQDGCFDDAAHFLRSFVDTNPYSKEGWYCLGCIYQDLRQNDRAADALQYAIAIDKHYAMALIELARVQEESGHVGDAATTLNHMLEFVTDRSDVYRALGQLFIRQENFDTAMLYLRKAVVENEHDADSLALIAICHLRQDDISMASSMAKRALAIDPENPDALCCMAMIYDAKDNFEGASDYFERLILSNRYNEMHCRFYVIFLFKRAVYDILIEFAVESLEVYPHDPFYSTYLAAAYFLSNRYNSLRHILPDVDPDTLHELCPTLWEHPRLAPLLPPLKNEN